MAIILIVDDRPANREYLVTLLGYGGHRLLEAADGAEGLALARAERPDLVIADILMPTMDGYEFVRQLRADPAVAGTPVIFYTAHYLEREARALADACGVSHILSKPAQPETVLRTVDAALGMAPPPAPAPAAEDFDREHLRLLTDKLSQKVDELRRANERLSALVDLGLDLGSERDPQRLLQNSCHTAREIVGARFALVGVLDGDGLHLRHCFTSGMDPAAAGALGSLDPRQGVLGTVLSAGRACRLHNPGGDLAGLGLPPSFPRVHSLLAAPIVSLTQVYGWLCLIDKLGAEEFSAEEERLAEILAGQLGRVYENGHLYAEIRGHVAGLEREMAERKRVEEALQEREQHIRLLLDSTAEAIYGLDVQGRFTFCNRTCVRLLGFAGTGDLIGKNVHALIHAKRPDGTPYPEEQCPIYQTFRQGEVRHGDDEMFWRADGTSLPVEYWSYPVRQGEELVGAVVTFLDLTERRSLEEQYRQAQKMEAVGRLAGGVAHDFNNLLTVISGYGQLVLASLPPGDPNRELVREIAAAGDRAAGLTRQLLAFSRKQLVAPRVLDLKALLADLDSLVRRVIGEDVHLVTASDPDLWPVKADPGQVEQVVLNLVVNARDAMPTGGRLTIETRNVELDESYARGHAGAGSGPHVLLAVTDSGVGMDAATQARMFEPFFTTKGEKGTGLGLATVYGIVKQAGGHVSVYSEPSQGSTFKVYLPRAPKGLPVSKSHPGLSAMPRGTETVLLVEDEEGVRALTRHVLNGCGYTVLEAADGRQAVRVAEQYGGQIDLLVTDVVMPDMGGRAVAERLLASRPGLKVLYLSGYTDDAVVRHGILEAQVQFVQKPFSPAALAQKVRDVLDSP
jgi:PAS domain S-box-containing protein